MTKQNETVAHNELVGGVETTLHSHAGGGGADFKPYQVYDATGDQSQGGAATVNLDTVKISNANYSLANDEITIGEAGTYLVSYTLCLDLTNTSGGTRGSTKGWMESDDGGAYVAVTGSYDYDYQREAASDPGIGLSATFLLVHANANKKIRLRFQRIYGSTNMDTIANETSVSILKVA